MNLVERSLTASLIACFPDVVGVHFTVIRRACIRLAAQASALCALRVHRCWQVERQTRVQLLTFGGTPVSEREDVMRTWDSRADQAS